MADIDYEAEYNNRARVPEHRGDFRPLDARGENYRAETLKAGRAELGLSYGDTPRQILRSVPAGRPAKPRRSRCSSMAAGGVRSIPPVQPDGARLRTRAGIAVAVVGYDLCPERRHRRHHRANPPRLRVSVAALRPRACCWFTDIRPAAISPPRWSRPIGTALYPKAPADLVPAGYSISGVFDLAPLVGISVNQDLRLDAAEARDVSPVFWPVAARPDLRRRRRRARIRTSSSARARLIAQTWQQAGAQTRYEEIAGTNHFTVIDPLADPQSAMTARVAELAQRIKDR